MYKDEYIYIYKFNHKIFFEIVINRVTLLVLHEEIFFFFLSKYPINNYFVEIKLKNIQSLYVYVKRIFFDNI